MTKETYLRQLKALTSEYESKKSTLKKEYALANNPYEIGSIFEDHIGKILVEKIDIVTPYGNQDIPSCLYTGPEIKKDGTSKKGNRIRSAWQINGVSS